MIAFGPIPSRRLGCSLGINHIPPKHCTYSCIYCQVGRTTSLSISRRDFYPPDQIIAEVDKKISESKKIGQPIDYLTLVPDGEPTLDRNLGPLIRGLKKFGIPVAVISNASLITDEDVQDALFHADWLSMKVDALHEEEWRKINRPHRRLSLASILSGIIHFRNRYPGTLVTETMIISGINDGNNSIRDLSEFLLDLKPNKSYFSMPIRPPAESWVKPPSPASLQYLFDTISKLLPSVDFLFESETGNFSSSGNLAEDILGITAVHPLRESALRRMVEHAQGDWKVVEELVAADMISRILYREEPFYFRNFSIKNRPKEKEDE